MNNGIAKIIIAVILGFFILKTCSNRNASRQNYSTEAIKASSWEKSPVDKIVKSLSAENNFSIILQDMDSRDGKYYHQYNIIIEHPDTVSSKPTDWEPVTETFFADNVNNMGMEIATKKDGRLSKVASPAGYNNYIGNEKYGHWTERNGSSFWSFYGRYAFMSSMFNMMAYPARRSYYNDYRGGYYGSRPYYGPSGSNMYGTTSYTSTGAGKTSTWGSKPTNFKSQVRSQVSRSSSAAKARTYSSRSSYSKKTRTSSRYSSTSSRSRSGGFGK